MLLVVALSAWRAQLDCAPRRIEVTGYLSQRAWTGSAISDLPL